MDIKRVAVGVFAVLVLLAIVLHRSRPAVILPPPPFVVEPPPLFSSPEWHPHEREAVQQLLTTAFASELASAKNGFILLGADGHVLYQHHATTDLTPASTLKVLTGATAMRLLGPEYHFLTRVSTLNPLDSGVIHGNLFLTGGGDPFLSSDDLRNAVRRLRELGLHSITGHVVVDATAFTHPEQNPHWPIDDLNLDYAAGTSALSLDEDVIAFHIRPTTPGAPALVRLDPADPHLHLQGQITSGVAGEDSTVTIDHVKGQDTFVLGGHIAPGEEQNFPIPIGDIRSYVAGVFDTMLRQQGIEIGGQPTVEVAPFGAQTLWVHRSPSLRAIIHHMLIVSDNHVAEQLLRTIAASQGHTGSEAAGIAVEQSYLRELGVDDRGLQIYDGSGLAPVDRIAPMSLARVLCDGLAVPGRPLITGLPRVGIEGTVKDHLLTTALGHVRAKSGHITGVDGLAGIIDTRKHGPLVFVFLANDADDATIESAEDTVLNNLVGF